MIHELKILPEYFEAVSCGKKLFEVRREDRGERFLVGDFLALNEHDGCAYTSRCCMVEVVYTLRDPNYVPEGSCIMGIYPCSVGRLSDRAFAFGGDLMQAPVYSTVSLRQVDGGTI